MDAKRFTGRRQEFPGTVPPIAIAVEDFAAERADGAQDLFEALGQVDVVPRHLRRRARSWRPFGSSRCRPPVVADAKVVRCKKRRYRRIAVDNSRGDVCAAAVIASEKIPSTGAVHVRVRKHWRRPALLLRAHTSLTPVLGGNITKYLGTHVWHAKRTHMENLWNYRLAGRNCGLGTRALYRATSRYCTMHDRSYMQAFEIFGSDTAILQVLNYCGVAKQRLMSAEARSGTRRVRVLLYACDENRLMAPALILWSPALCTRAKPEEQIDEPSSEEETLPFVVDVGHDIVIEEDVQMSSGKLHETQTIEKGWKLWIWVHPAAAEEATQFSRVSV